MNMNISHNKTVSFVTNSYNLFFFKYLHEKHDKLLNFIHIPISKKKKSKKETTSNHIRIEKIRNKHFSGASNHTSTQTLWHVFT